MTIESGLNRTYTQRLPNGPSFDLIYVKGGSSFFGDSDIEITLADFCIGQYPVTQALWQAVMEDNSAHFQSKNRPVESTSWFDAAAFCNALNILTGYPSVYFLDEKFQERLNYTMTRQLEYMQDIDVFQNFENPGYRLPSETEWEYAARGGGQQSAYEYAGSDKLEEVGWYEDNSHRETKPVGLKAPNQLNLYDMSGNVREWCDDQVHMESELKNIPKDGSSWVDHEKDAFRMYRGGRWSRNAQYSSAKFRSNSKSSLRDNSFGIRVVLFPPPVPNN